MQTLCDMHVGMDITQNIIVCVSMTSPCPLNRSMTYWQIMEMIYFGEHGPSAPLATPILQCHLR